MKKLLAILMVMVMAMAHTASASGTASDSTNELVPCYSVYAGVEPILTSVEVFDGQLADTHMYFEVSFDSFSDYYTFIVKEKGYQVIAYDYDNDYGWLQATFAKGNITFVVSYLAPPFNNLKEYYPHETAEVTTETNAGAAAAPASTSAPAPTYTACPHCYGGWIDCSTCGTFGMCRYCDGFGYRSRYTSDGYEYLDCNYCGGTGACSRCGYSGFLECTYCGGTGIQN